MKHSIPVVLLLGFLISGCAKTIQPVSEMSRAAPVSCPDFYYYYNQERIPLTPMPQFVAVGFARNISPETKTNLLKQYPPFMGLDKGHPAETSVVHIAALKPETTCEQVLNLVKELKKNEAVLYANLVFAAPSSVGGDYSWITTTSEFLVTLKSADAAGEFNKLVAETKTRVAEKLGETSYMLIAGKNAKGDALEMANRFQQQDWVENAEPNFYFANSPLPQTD